MLRNSFQDNFNRRGFLTEIVFVFVLIIWMSIGFKSIIFYQSELPIFLYTKSYSKQFLFYSGGIAEYLAAFLRQFYFSFQLGILISVSLVYLVLLLSTQIVETLNVHSNFRFVRFIPALFLFYIHGNYNHDLAFTVGFLLVLLAFYCFIRIVSRRNTVFRIGLFLLLLLIVYYTSGGLFLLFSALSILYEFLFNPSKTRFYSSVVFVAFSVILPYLSIRYLFPTTLYNSYFYLIPDTTVFKNCIGEFLLLLFFPALLFVVLISNTIARPIIERIKFGYIERRISSNSIKTIIRIVSVVVAVSLTYFVSRDKATDVRMKIQFHALNNQWEAVLKVAEKYPMVDKIVNFQINRALFHTGQLGEKLFQYPQLYGYDGLFVDRHDDNSLIELSSDLYFDLGFINESKHWAYESFVFYGNKPRLLQRLANIYIINGNYGAALKYLNLLSNTLFYRKWANENIVKCNNPKLFEKDSFIQEKRKYAPQFDFFADRSNPDVIMKLLLEQNNENKMAFEYLMAYYLLGHKFLAFNDNLYRLNDFDYKNIPQNFQEVIAVIMDIKGEDSVKLGKYKFDRNVMNDFRAYIYVMQRNKGDFSKAHKPLKAKFGDTYWYFLDYTSPITQKLRTKGKTN